MGRMYYANTKQCDDRIVHILTTARGTVVLAMRPPDPGERGYSIGVDFTVKQAVDEMLTDWGPSDDGPGWVRAKDGNARGDAQTYDVTILAAFDLDEHQRTEPPLPVDEYVQFFDEHGKDLGSTPIVKNYGYADGSYGLLERYGDQGTVDIERTALNAINNYGYAEGMVVEYKVTWKVVREARPVRARKEAV
jgi:hypothetical protein